MAVAKAILAQRNFSGGALEVSAKRSDENPLVKVGARQCSDWRILNSGALQNRPGRRALFFAFGRCDEITIAPGVVYRFSFNSGGVLKIFDAAGAQVFSQSGFPWTTVNLVNTLVCAVYQHTVYIFCQNSSVAPTQMIWDNVTPWTAVPYTFDGSSSAQSRSLFYRLSQLNVTMLPSATTGVIMLTFSAAIADPGMIGTRMRYCGRQIAITGFTSTLILDATVQETLPGSMLLPVAATPFTVGDEVIGQTSGAKGIVIAIVAGVSITVQLVNSSGSPGTFGNIIDFVNPEIVVGPGGTSTINGAVVPGTPGAVAIWDDEVINNFRGWPRSGTVDQNRLILCDIPALPNAIAWSAIGAMTDLYVDAQPNSAMMELTPDKTRVLYVVAGPESSEFVFTDRRLYYIPITPTNPLRPGSVAFQILSDEGCGQVQPRAVQELILYMNAGLTSVMSVMAPGAYYRPYETRNVTELHSHLIKTPIAIAVPSASAQFDERYAYVLNSDGTMAVGKYTVESGQIKGAVGWIPWRAEEGTIDWISARDAVVMFVTRYAGATLSVVEQLDNTLYLDGAVFVNALPTPLQPPGGKGPLYWIPNSTVQLMDQSTRTMGTYQIDANGFIVPQNNGGENLAAATLVAGHSWDAIFEPFVPAVQPGEDKLQRMRKRRIARLEIYVSTSSGFRVDRLATEQEGLNIPPPGTVLSSRRVPPWNMDDDPTLPPRLREQAYPFKPLGRSHDPRMVLVKDTPGPLQLLEWGMEVSV